MHVWRKEQNVDLAVTWPDMLEWEPHLYVPTAPSEIHVGLLKKMIIWVEPQ